MKLLSPLALPYSFVVNLRNKAFDWGFLKSESAGVPVISIGNITVGGTGKTPLVEYVAGMLTKLGKRVGVISRGYGRTSRGVVVVSDGQSLSADAMTGGDEPVQIAMKIPGAIVVVAEKRVDAARVAVKLGAQVLIMDDGFQHRYLKRDLDVVVVDTSDAGFPDPVLPAGRAREPWSGLQRADLLVFSKLAEVATLGIWRNNVARWYQGPGIGFQMRMTTIKKAEDHSNVAVDVLSKESIVAFSGIGGHESFTKSLSGRGLTIAGELEFADHHTYSHSDLARIKSLKDRVGARFCVTTEKDVVRLSGNPPLRLEFARSLNLHYAGIDVEFVEGEQLFVECIKKIVA